MGAVTSSTATANTVVGAHEYATWPLERVAAALQRAPGVLLKDYTGPEEGKQDAFHERLSHMTRMQFWEIFTDYEVVRSDTSAFLNLSMSVFEAFASIPEQAASPRRKRAPSAARQAAAAATAAAAAAAARPVTESGTESVDGHELFLVLILFCHGDVEDQLAVAYELFDLDGDNELTLDEMLQMMKALTTGSWRVKLTKRMPEPAELERLTKHMFSAADVDNDTTISRDEFVKWAKGHVASQRLLHSFKKEKERLPVNVMSVRKLEHSHGVSSATIARRARLVHSKQAQVASQALLGRLQTKTTFNAIELRKLRTVFMQESSDTGELNRAQFIRVMISQYPHLAEVKLSGPKASWDRQLNKMSDDQLIKQNPQLNMLFSAFDEDLSESIDFSEFTFGLSKLTRGTMEDKVEMLFEVYDADGDGTVSVQEMLKFLLKESDDVYEAAEFASELLGAMDENGDGSLSKDEFLVAMKDEPLLYECFIGSLLPRGAATLTSQLMKDTVETVTRKNKHFNIGFLKKMWATCKRDGTSERKMTLLQFRKWMQDSFKCGIEILPLVNRVFQVFDSKGNGSVKFRELLSALSQVVLGSNEQRAEFYFQLYDIDKSGVIDKEEIVTMLQTSRAGAETGMAEVAAVLQQLGKDTGGSVSLKDFKAACEHDPTLMELFGSIFGVETIVKPTSQAERLTTSQQRQCTQIVSLLDDGELHRAASMASQSARTLPGIVGGGSGSGSGSGLKPSLSFASVARQLTGASKAVSKAKTNLRTNRRRGLAKMKELDIGMSSRVLNQLVDTIPTMAPGMPTPKSAVTAATDASLTSIDVFTDELVQEAVSTGSFVAAAASVAAAQHAASLLKHVRQSKMSLRSHIANIQQPVHEAPSSAALQNPNRRERSAAEAAAMAAAVSGLRGKHSKRNISVDTDDEVGHLPSRSPRRMQSRRSLLGSSSRSPSSPSSPTRGGWSVPSSPGTSPLAGSKSAGMRRPKSSGDLRRRPSQRRFGSPGSLSSPSKAMARSQSVSVMQSKSRSTMPLATAHERPESGGGGGGDEAATTAADSQSPLQPTSLPGGKSRISSAPATRRHGTASKKAGARARAHRRRHTQANSHSPHSRSSLVPSQSLGTLSGSMKHWQQTTARPASSSSLRSRPVRGAPVPAAWGAGSLVHLEEDDTGDGEWPGGMAGSAWADESLRELWESPPAHLLTHSPVTKPSKRTAANLKGVPRLSMQRMPAASGSTPQPDKRGNSATGARRQSAPLSGRVLAAGSGLGVNNATVRSLISANRYKGRTPFNM